MSGTYGLEPKATLSDSDQCVDVRALVPGDPDQMRIVAARFRRVGEGASRVVDLMHRVDVGDWVGDSGDLFRKVTGDARIPFVTTAEVMHSVSVALEDLADTIDAARVVARRSGELIGEAQAASASWELARSGTDPGAPIRAHAHRTLTDAQREVNSSAQRAVQVLRDGRVEAPDGHEWRSMAEGFTDSVAQSAALAWSLAPTRWLTDPDQAMQNYQAFGASLAEPVLHPRQAASQLWQQLDDDPNRFFGSLLPGMLLSAPQNELTALLRARLLPNSPHPDLLLEEPEFAFGTPLTAAPHPADQHTPAAQPANPEPLTMRHGDDGANKPLGPLPPGPLTPEQQHWLEDESAAIVDGHAWKDHYLKGELPWVNSREELLAYVQSVIRSPDDYYEALRGRLFFWDERHQVIVTVDMYHEGTIFRASAGKARYDTWVSLDRNERGL